MSKLNALLLSGVFAATAILVVPAQAAAQTRPGLTVAAERAAASARPIRVAPNRPTVVDRGPDRRPGQDPGDHLQQRLRNACFHSHNPPVELCRRYFGQDHGRTPAE